MKFKIYDDVYDDAEDCAEALINLEPCELDEAFDEYLDEVYGTINVAGYDYDTSYVLREIDPIAYRCDKNDYIDSLRGDIESELEGMYEGEEREFYGYYVECIDEEVA